MPEKATDDAPEQSHLVDLPAFGTHPEARHVLDRMSALAINAALAAERPLLVRGEPGTGKSQLARAAAVLLKRRFLPYTVDSRTETRDLRYTVDAVSRLAHAQLAGAMQAAGKKVEEVIDVMNFVHPGPLWWAYDWKGASEHAKRVGVPEPSTAGPPDATATVLLIDEIDKADPSVPNGLLDAFGNGRFDVEGRVTVKSSLPHPLVIITTNEERALPDAFVRRCLVLNLALPTERAKLIDVLASRGEANVKDAHRDVLRFAAELIADDRAALATAGVCLPGVAEYVDLLRAVVEPSRTVKAQKALLEEIKHLATRKHPVERGG